MSMPNTPMHVNSKHHRIGTGCYVIAYGGEVIRTGRIVAKPFRGAIHGPVGWRLVETPEGERFYYHEDELARITKEEFHAIHGAGIQALFDD